MDKNIDIRDAFFEEIYKIIASDKNTLFIADDMDAFVLQKLRRNFPKQYINIGVAEQNLMNVAAGLAACGRKVFVYGICSYITSRCYEQIKFSICSMNLPVTIIGVGAGFSFPFDGATHHGTIDVGIMRLLPEITILSPIDFYSARYSAVYSYKSRSPVYVRLDKGKFDKIYEDTPDAKRGFKEIHDAKSVNVISTGYMSQLVAALFRENKDLSQKLGLLDVYQIKPLPRELLVRINNCKEIISIEENSYSGGLGTMLSEYLCDNNLKIKLRRLASKDKQFLEYGTRDYLLRLNKLHKSSLFRHLKNGN